MDKASKFVEGMSYEEFIQDDKTIFAVVRAIEIFVGRLRMKEDSYVEMM